MYKRLFPLIAASAMLLTAKAEKSLLTINPFQQISVSGPLNVDCIHNPDSVGYLVIDAPARDQLPWVEVKNKGDKLALKLALPDEVRRSLDGVPANLPRVTVYTNYLVKAENNGDSTLRVLSAQDVPQFEARLIGNGRLSVRGIRAEKLKGVLFSGRGIMVLNGSALKATYSLTGVGTIEADGVSVPEATVRLTGTGSVGVNATKKLTVSGSGSGTVFFKGTPEIKKKISIGLNLQPID